MTRQNKWRQALELLRNHAGFRGLAAFLTPLLLFCLSALTPSGEAHCRTGARPSMVRLASPVRMARYGAFNKCAGCGATHSAARKQVFA